MLLKICKEVKEILRTLWYTKVTKQLRKGDTFTYDKNGFV